jgi:hypothetical protein
VCFFLTSPSSHVEACLANLARLSSPLLCPPFFCLLEVQVSTGRKAKKHEPIKLLNNNSRYYDNNRQTMFLDIFNKLFKNVKVIQKNIRVYDKEPRSLRGWRLKGQKSRSTLVTELRAMHLCTDLPASRHPHWRSDRFVKP